ncbi:FadR/GntR family transcriptional regulator [Breznakiella homolactica]|uniref:FadR family transcriptional regulator n=1 Tax=Breznakiella homolactica TaxID=2798577 RepID=A0A7T7XPM0_9SPIR|nr:GntR family transcriptional regulator [Breznakiella homolactica]QQO10164.1 GntR family transcriptional regulator [Breznakiella homolactica]
MEAIPKQRIDDIVYDRLLANIQAGTWKSGEKIPSEPELCRMLNVSRISVRSAIQRLRAIGLVEVKQGKGTYVISPEEIFSFSDSTQVLDLTEKEFNEINDLREAIETKSIQLVIEQNGKANLSGVETAYMNMKEALRNRDYEEYTRNDYLFHLSIVIAANNDIFIQIMNIVKKQYYKYFRELNKFMFDDSKSAEALIKNSGGPSDSHTILYNYLTGKQEVDGKDLVKTFTSGNKKRFAAYLRKRGQTEG